MERLITFTGLRTRTSFSERIPCTLQLRSLSTSVSLESATPRNHGLQGHGETGVDALHATSNDEEAGTSGVARAKSGERHVGSHAWRQPLVARRRRRRPPRGHRGPRRPRRGGERQGRQRPNPSARRRRRQHRSHQGPPHRWRRAGITCRQRQYPAAPCRWTGSACRHRDATGRQRRPEREGRLRRDCPAPGCRCRATQQPSSPWSPSARS